MAIVLTDEDKINLAVIGGYTILILVLWRMPFLKWILYPFKLVTIAFHEFGHASTGVCTGGKVNSIEVDPDLGGATELQGGVACITLPAGYLGSSIFGAVMIMCGFDNVASKVCSIVVMLALLCTLYWAKNWLLRILTLAFVVLIAFLWWPWDGAGLRYVVLFMGVMSALYSVWDILEDLVFRKVNESDATKFAKMTKVCPSQFWGFLWFLFSLAFMAGGILAGIVVF